jgi:O-antigen/teichoic acid export membrane protein
VAIVAMSLLLWPTSLEDARMRTLLAGLLVLPLLALGNLRGAALRGLAHPALGQLPEAVVRPVVLAGGVALAAAWSGKPVGPASAMLLLAAASAIAWLLGRGLLRRRRPGGLTRAVVPEYRGRAWFTAAASLGLVAALQLVLGQTDVLMLGLLRSDEEVGIYRVAVQLSLLVGLGLEVAHMVTAPWVARYGVEGRLADLERLMKWASRAVFAAATLVLLVLVVLGEQLLALCFGAAFVGAQLPMVLLGVGRLLAGGFGPVGMVLQMTGFERATVLGVGLAAATNAVLNVLLIPTFGSAGAATATGAALVLSHLVLHRLVVQRLGIDASVAPGVRLRAFSRETG